MRKFENLTDFELLNGAYGYYLVQWQEAHSYRVENPHDRLARSREERYDKMVEELYARLLEISPSYDKIIEELYDKLYKA